MSREFLILTYKIPSEPSTNRVYVWRSIKELGAIYLQQGVGILPYEQELYSVLLGLREQVQAFGGDSTLGRLSFLQEEDEKKVVAEFVRQVGEEYRELIKNCQDLIDEINEEAHHGDYSFSEIIEYEEEYIKFQRWYEKVAKRDYFSSEQRTHAVEVLGKAKARLQEYSDKVYKKDENTI